MGQNVPSRRGVLGAMVATAVIPAASFANAPAHSRVVAAIRDYREARSAMLVQQATEYTPMRAQWIARGQPKDAEWDRVFRRTCDYEVAVTDALDRVILSTPSESLADLRAKADLMDESGAFHDGITDWLQALRDDIRRLAGMEAQS